MGKSTISMVIFNSKLLNWTIYSGFTHLKTPFIVDLPVLQLGSSIRVNHRSYLLVAGLFYSATLSDDVTALVKAIGREEYAFVDASRRRMFLAGFLQVTLW